jgi:hypothetical protein
MAGTPFDFFDFVACINLPDATARWQACTEEFARMGITGRVEQLHATPPPAGLTIPGLRFSAGNVGANLSHVKALTHGLARRARAALVFEDDVYLTDDGLQTLAAAVGEMPEAWDVLYLGGNPKGPMARVGPHLLRVSAMFGAFAYAVEGSFIPRLLDMAFDGLFTKPFDALLGGQASTGRCLCVSRPVCGTRPGHSIVRDAFRSYDQTIADNWARYAPP